MFPSRSEKDESQRSNPNEYDYHGAAGVARDGDGRVQRRTIVQGAAWTIPVVALAAATPAAAASLQPTLEFVNGPYTANACDVLDNVVIKATTDGSTPSAGATVTVTLPEGLAWSDGSTGPRGFTTDGNGQVVLDGLRTTDSAGGTYPITATSGALTTSSAVTVSPAPANRLVSSSGVSETTPNGLAITDVALTRRGDTATGNGYYVVTTSDGSLWSYEENVGWSQRGNTGVDLVAVYGSAAPAYFEAYASGSQLTSNTGVSQTTPNGLAITDLDVVRRDDSPTGNGYYVVTTSDGSLWSYEENVGWSQRGQTGLDHVAA